MDLLGNAMHNVSTPSQDVCLSVRLSHAGILSKQLNISSNCFHHRVATPNGMAILWRGPPYMQDGMKKIEIFDQYLALSRKWYQIEP